LGRYSLEFAFFSTEGAETFPMSNHFVSTDGALSFVEELNGRELSKRRDAILREKLTISTYTN
jgi:hypothetical protein